MIYSLTAEEKKWFHTETKGYSEILRAYANKQGNKDAESEGKRLERLSRKFTENAIEVDLSGKDKAVCLQLLLNRINHLVTKIIPSYEKDLEKFKHYYEKALAHVTFLTGLVEKIHVTDHAYAPQ